MLIRHGAVYVVAKLVPGLIGMAATALLTRLLSPAAYGEYGLALVVMTFGSAAGFDWLGLAYLRLGGARADPSRAAATALALFAALVAITAIAAAGAWAMGCFTGPAAASIAAGLVLMWCYAGFELAARFHIARSDPRRYLVMNLGRALLSAAVAIAVAWWTRNPAATALGLAAGTLGGTALGGWPCRRGVADPRLARAMLAFGLPLAASLALAAVATSGARSLIEILASAEQLGWYTAAFLVVQNTLAVVAAGIASAGYPAAVRAVDRGDATGAERLLRANATLLLAVLSPMAVGMALTAPGLAGLLVGAAYAPAVAALTPWLAAAGYFASLRGQFLDYAFQLGKRPGLQLSVTAVAAAISVGLTLVVVPRWGALGAAVAQCVAMAVSCAHALVIGRRAWPMPLPRLAALRVTAACAAMALAVRLAPGGLAGQVVAGAASYGMALLLLGGRTVLRRQWPVTPAARASATAPATPPLRC